MLAEPFTLAEFMAANGKGFYDPSNYKHRAIIRDGLKARGYSERVRRHHGKPARVWSRNWPSNETPSVDPFAGL